MSCLCPAEVQVSIFRLCVVPPSGVSSTLVPRCLLANHYSQQGTPPGTLPLPRIPSVASTDSDPIAQQSPVASVSNFARSSTSNNITKNRPILHPPHVFLNMTKKARDREILQILSNPRKMSIFEIFMFCFFEFVILVLIFIKIQIIFVPRSPQVRYFVYAGTRYLYWCSVLRYYFTTTQRTN